VTPPLESIDPATGDRVLRVPVHTPAVVEHRLAAASAAQRAWAELPLAARVDVIRRVAAALRAEKDAWARLMALEVGKRLVDGAAELEKCAATLDALAAEAPRALAPLVVDAHGHLTPAEAAVPVGALGRRVRLEPIGVVLSIMPWNFPFWQVVRAAGPALLLGDAVLLKHASQVPGCALALERAFDHALRAIGAPPGVFTTLLLQPDAVPALIGDPRVAMVTLTGSERAGVAVATEAGRALKRCVLELGGSDPFVVLDDADLDRAAEVAVRARVQNAGQSCIAAKRFVVHRAIARPFVERFRAGLAALRMGSPLDARTTLGPMSRVELRDALHAQVERSQALGARVTLGGVVPDGPGAFYPATLVEGAGPGMPVWDEETFGPVAAVAIGDDDAALAALARHPRYALGAAVFSRDPARAERIGAATDAGMVFVNGMVRSDVSVPFGGNRRSGYGRELTRFGYAELANVRTLWVEP
jgi:succinate-semialdehyde dehydrogenase/glutarate-semialdehyde dehydrogenase